MTILGRLFVMTLLMAGGCARTHDGATLSTVDAGPECLFDEDCGPGIPCVAQSCVRTVDPLDAGELPQNDAGRPLPADGAVASTIPADACRQHSDCELVPANCCDACEASSDAFRALTKSEVPKFWKACGTVSCTCSPVEDLRISAACIAGQCEVVHAGTRPDVAACKAHSDCQVRVAGCCECDADTSKGKLLSVSSEAAYEALVCSDTSQCGSCAAEYPAGATAFCNRGFCQVADPRVQ